MTGCGSVVDVGVQWVWESSGCESAVSLGVQWVCECSGCLECSGSVVGVGV